MTQCDYFIAHWRGTLYKELRFLFNLLGVGVDKCFVFPLRIHLFYHSFSFCRFIFVFTHFCVCSKTITKMLENVPYLSERLDSIRHASTYFVNFVFTLWCFSIIIIYEYMTLHTIYLYIFLYMYSTRICHSLGVLSAQCALPCW